MRSIGFNDVVDIQSSIALMQGWSYILYFGRALGPPLNQMDDPKDNPYTTSEDKALKRFKSDLLLLGTIHKRRLL